MITKAITKKGEEDEEEENNNNNKKKDKDKDKDAKKDNVYKSKQTHVELAKKMA